MALLQLCTLAAALVPNLPFQVGTEASLRDRLYTEGVSGWQQLSAAALHLQGRGLEKNSSRNREYTWTFKTNGDWICFEYHNAGSSGEPQTSSARGCNSKYTFRLKKNDSTAEWALLTLDSDMDPWSREHPRFFAWALGFEKYLQTPWTILGMPLSTMIQESGFAISSIAEELDGEKNLVRLTFTYAPPPSYKPDLTPSGSPRRITPHDTLMRGGWVLLDPANFWSVQRYEVTCPIVPNGKSTGRVEYGFDVAGVRLPSLVVLEDSDGTGKSTQSFVFQELKHRDVPESEFTLSAYGLPEPMGVTWPKPTPWWRWMLGAAAGAAVLMLGFLYLRKRALAKAKAG